MLYPAVFTMMDSVWIRPVITLLVVTAVTAPLPNPPGGFRYCDGDFTTPGLCMEIVTEAMDWHDAATYCQTQYRPHPGRLVKLKLQAVQDWVAGLLEVMQWEYVWFNGCRKQDIMERAGWFWQRRLKAPYLAYQGCFRDNPSAPDLKTFIPTSGNVPHECLDLCDKLFASVQLDVNGKMQCQCDTDFGQYGRVYDSQCDTVCPPSVSGQPVPTDSINRYCGGPGYQRVYLRQGRKFSAFAPTVDREYHHCVVMNHQFDHRWTEHSCHQEEPYICWYRGLSENQCSHTWVHRQCISIHHEQKDFFTATTNCYSDNADLFNIGDKFLQMAVTALLNPTRSYFIGLTDEEWIDTDKMPILSYFNWAPGQPNDEEINACLKMRRESNYGWYNSDCRNPLRFMCIINVTGSQNTPHPSPPPSPPASQLPVITPTPSPAPSASTTTGKGQTQETVSGLSLDVVIGLAAGGGGALVLTIVLIVGFCFWRRHHQQKSKKRKSRNQVRSRDLPATPKMPPVDKNYSKTNPAYKLDVHHQPHGMHPSHVSRSIRSEASYAELGYTGYEDLNPGSVDSHTYRELNHDKYEYIDMPGQGKYASNSSGNKGGKGGHGASRSKDMSGRGEYESNRSEKSYDSSKSGRSSHKSGYAPSR